MKLISFQDASLDNFLLTDDLRIIECFQHSNAWAVGQLMNDFSEHYYFARFTCPARDHLPRFEVAARDYATELAKEGHGVADFSLYSPLKG